LRQVAPAQEEGSKRMLWMSRVCVQWTLEDLCAMEEQDMEKLLESYAPNTVPSFNTVRGMRNGSIGWLQSYWDSFATNVRIRA